MRSLDRRLLRRARGAFVALGADVAFGVLAALAVLAQAVLIATIVADAFAGRSPGGALLLLLVVVVAGRSGLSTAIEAVGRRAAGRVMSDLRMDLIRRRLRAPDMAAPADEAGEEGEAGEVATAAVQGVDALESYFARYLPQLALAVLVPVTVLTCTALVDPVSAVIMLVTLPLIPIFMVLIGQVTEARTRERWQALARLSNHFLDVVRGLPTLRAWGRGAAQAERIAATSEEYRATTMRVLRLSFLSGAVLDFLATIATALVAVSLGIRLVDGTVTLRAALIVLLLTPELYAPLRALAAQYHAAADGLAAAQRIIDLIDADPARPEAGRLPCPPCLPWRAVRLNGVTVRHRSRPVLDRLDLEIGRGEIVALVGPSGAGKSTVAALLLGLRRPDAGTITVDSRTLDSLDPAAWRRQIGWLPQRPTLFRGTVHDNITMGARVQVEAAAALTGADDFVRDLRHGYDTVVGPGGRGLSAGETRRIALARALARQDTRLLILDEPTAHLDSGAARRVLEAIKQAAPGRAVLLIEHHPDAAAIADRIVRVENGKNGKPVPT
ncbi:thiol reductant ABC exporter subunit CydD [Actinomadura barringtoniae]|uniref:Thiol reductant ABC exporter subunit CydD n=1 Tax=Actinomadura barringtoniae TaxID=1427535 RepID=A0A939T8F8_9ACTN|nr:thiol reductant ABC exporter subunit CydD [Actinomadura barringtoniae]MBO2453084.1 thiol reductant ABC exporter subunit CydD [Actinomadura barringtoniae]